MAGGVNPLISGTGSPPGGTLRKNAQRGILMSTEGKIVLDLCMGQCPVVQMLMPTVTHMYHCTQLIRLICRVSAYVC